MKIQCPNCKTQYDLDDKKIPNKKIKFKCRQCQNPVYIHKSDDSHPEQLTCPRCGQQQALSDECVHCGTTLVKDKPQANPDGPTQPEPNLVNETLPADKPLPKQQMVNCPKCSHELQPDDLECYNCGIVVEKYKAFTAKVKQAEQESRQQVGEVSGKSEEELA